MKSNVELKRAKKSDQWWNVEEEDWEKSESKFESQKDEYGQYNMRTCASCGLLLTDDTIRLAVLIQSFSICGRLLELDTYPLFGNGEKRYLSYKLNIITKQSLFTLFCIYKLFLIIINNLLIKTKHKTFVINKFQNKNII